MKTSSTLPHQIGKAFSVLGILQALLPVVSKPAFAFLYQQTLASFPATFLLVVAVLYSGVLAILVFTHFGLKVIYTYTLLISNLLCSGERAPQLKMWSSCLSLNTSREARGAVGRPSLWSLYH